MNHSFKFQNALFSNILLIMVISCFPSANDSSFGESRKEGFKRRDIERARLESFRLHKIIIIIIKKHSECVCACVYVYEKKAPE